MIEANDEPRPVRWVVNGETYRGMKLRDAVISYYCDSDTWHDDPIECLDEWFSLTVQGPHDDSPETTVVVRPRLVFDIEGLRGGENE